MGGVAGSHPELQPASHCAPCSVTGSQDMSTDKRGQSALHDYLCLRIRPVEALKS